MRIQLEKRKQMNKIGLIFNPTSIASEVLVDILVKVEENDWTNWSICDEVGEFFTYSS